LSLHGNRRRSELRPPAGSVDMANEDSRRAHGQRMRKLQNAFHVTVKYALRGIPPEEFHVHFPEETFPEPILEVLYDAYVQVIICERQRAATAIRGHPPSPPRRRSG
jgi:hypothetical protein